MRITVFTSNQPRHLSLIRELAGISDEVFAVIEVNTLFPGKRADFYNRSEVMQRYFSKVIRSERKVFGKIALLPSNVRTLILKSGDLNDLTMDVLTPVLRSDEYIVFGSSYIKGDLIDFLVTKGAYNIHMGVSPYYRGSSCNFWAAYDRNYTLVGATIHLLSKGLDSGPILFHVLPAPTDDVFDLGMNAVQSAHIGLVQQLASGKIKEYQPITQDRTREIRYTKNIDFSDRVALEYLDNLPAREEIMHSFTSMDKNKYINLFMP